MRAFLGFAVLSLGVLGPWPEIQPATTHIRTAVPAHVVVRSAKADRQPLIAEQSTIGRSINDGPVHATPRTGAALSYADIAFPADEAADTLVSAEDDAALEDDSPAAAERRAISSDQLCDAVLSSAQANDLPLAFFSNLIWQESRFDVRSVSHAGAQGIAQFMPATAARSGVEDPFDPFQALPASARLLRQLRDQFGNLGLAAAAYNAGPGRVSTFLKSGKLPRETRAYVRIITGRPAEQWRGVKEASAIKLAPRLPCRQMPIFADLEVARAEAAQADPTDTPKTAKDDARLPAQSRVSFTRTALRNVKGRLAGPVARRAAESVKVVKVAYVGAHPAGANVARKPTAKGGRTADKVAGKATSTAAGKTREVARAAPHKAAKTPPAHGKHRTA
jgi:soluble lytic murein transglycosylase-like protein